ncbi:MAG: hypothetical protein AAGJ28_00055 [Pseudomonadota bacterium]
MKKIRFNGFAQGSTVTIAGITVASWGGAEIAGGEDVWDQPASAGTSVTINIRRSDHQVAPEAMQFDLTLSGFEVNSGQNSIGYEPAYHDKYVFWDFEEEYSFTAPTQVIGMDAADGGNRTNARYMQGPLAAHTFRTAGTYRVRVAVLEPASGKWGQGTTTVTVGNPDTFYAGSRTVYVNTTGQYGNAPDGAQLRTSLVAALGILEAANAPHRIVLENNQTHTLTNVFGIFQPAGKSATGLRIEARLKTGNRPKIRLVGSNFDGDNFNDRFIVDRQRKGSPGAAAHGTVFQYLEVEGEWNPVTETGNSGTFYQNDGRNSGSPHVTVDQCVASGLWMFVMQLDTNNNGSSDGSDSGVMLCLTDNRFSDWADYGIFSNAQARHCLIGNRMAQNPDAATGGPKTEPPNNNRHGPIRISRPRADVIAYNDLFSCTGWSPWGSIHAMQAAIRWGTSPNLAGMRLNLQGNAMESAWTCMLLIPYASSRPMQLANALVEGNLVVAGFQSRAVVELAHGGTTIRNNVLTFAGVTHDSSSFGGLNSGIQSGAWVWVFGGTGGNPDNSLAPVRIYNNSLINLTPYRLGNTTFNNALGLDVASANNLFHEPNASPPNAPHAPLTATTAFLCRYKGYKDDTPISLQTQTAHAADTAQIWTPAIGSTALGSALNEPTASTDFRGDLRPEPPSAGAREAD